MDNKQGRKAAKVYGLGLLGSPETIVSLCKSKKINQNKAAEAAGITVSEMMQEAAAHGIKSEETLEELREGLKLLNGR